MYSGHKLYVAPDFIKQTAHQYLSEMYLYLYYTIIEWLLYAVVTRDLRNISEMMLCLGIDKCCEYSEMRSCGWKHMTESFCSG